MKSVGFWRPQDAPYSQNLFVYILQHPSREEARKNWAAFKADPEWNKVKADSEIVAGVILAITEVLIAFSQGHDPSLSLLLAGLGIAVALLGPGSRSVDARLSGWKRIEIRHPEN